MEKVAIFADVQNIYYTTRQSYQRHFNYNAFWTQATANREVVAAFAYAIDKGDSKQLGFQQILRNIGFEVKLKPYIQRNDGPAMRMAKAKSRVKRKALAGICRLKSNTS